MKRVLVPALGVAATIGCTLAVDVGEISEGCDTGKACGGSCVSLDRAESGCATTSCDPCWKQLGLDPVGASDIVQATRCNAAGQCEKACLDGFGCDDCTVNLLTDELNCGACGVPCGDEERCVCGRCCTEGEPCDSTPCTPGSN